MEDLVLRYGRVPDSWTAQDADEQAPAQATAVEQLQEELQTLSDRAGARIRDSEFVSADQFVELDGEAQTEKDLRDALIVQMVSTVLAVNIDER